MRKLACETAKKLRNSFRIKFRSSRGIFAFMRGGEINGNNNKFLGGVS